LTGDGIIEPTPVIDEHAPFPDVADRRDFISNPRHEPSPFDISFAQKGMGSLSSSRTSTGGGGGAA